MAYSWNATITAFHRSHLAIRCVECVLPWVEWTVSVGSKNDDIYPYVLGYWWNVNWVFILSFIPGQGLFVQYNSCWLSQVRDLFDETTWSSSLVFYVLKKQDSQLWVQMDRGLLHLPDAIQKQETNRVCVKKTAGIGWNSLEVFVILRMTSYTPSPIVSAVFSKAHNSFTRVSKACRTVLDVWTCIFKLQRMLVNSKASTLCSFPESVTLWLCRFNSNLYNGGCEEWNVA